MISTENHLKVLTREDLINVVSAIESADTIDELLNNTPKVMGVKHMTYHHFAAVGAFDFDALSKFHAYNMPEDILEFHRNNKAYAADPGIVATFKKGHFIWLSDLAFHPHVVEAGHSKLVNYALKSVGDGLCIPLYGPGNRKGYMFVSFGLSKSECDEIFPYQIQALAQKQHVRYCLMKKALQRQVNLTGREAEVLELLCFGKTNADIADSLKISANTVAGYVKQIFLKLETNDRVSAAMRAQSIKVSI